MPRSAASAGRWLIMISGRDEGLASPARARRPRHQQHAPGAQAGRQFAAQRASTLNEQPLIDGFMADAHGRVVKKVHRQATGDLLRARGPRVSPGLPWSVPTAFSRTRPGREQEPRSEPQRRQPTVPRHRFLAPRCAQASPALGGEQRARRAITLSSHDARGRRFALAALRRSSLEIVDATRPSLASDLLHGVALNAKERDLLPLRKREIPTTERLRR